MNKLQAAAGMKRWIEAKEKLLVLVCGGEPL